MAAIETMLLPPTFTPLRKATYLIDAALDCNQTRQGFCYLLTAWLCWPSSQVASQSYSGPYQFDHAEGPSARQEAVTAGQQASEGKRDHKNWVSALEPVHHHHECESYDPEYGDGGTVHGVTSVTVRPSLMTAKTALYLCSDTLISLMRGSVTHQPK